MTKTLEGACFVHLNDLLVELQAVTPRAHSSRPVKGMIDAMDDSIKCSDTQPHHDGW